jgi:hypothetical protein
LSGDRTRFSESASPASLPQGPASTGSRSPGTAVWARRIAVLLFVFLCAGVGVLLIILPWTDQWTDNRLLLEYPQLRSIVSSGFTRGVCTGLGLIDIWIGFWEAIHYHEDKPTAS